MATVKTTSGDYTITVNGGIGTLTINADLDVVGNITYISSTELKIDDPFILVGANNTGAIGNLGMIAQKTASSWAGLRFNTTDSQWEISPSVQEDGAEITPYAPISSGALVAGNVGEIQFNGGGTFSASANLSFDVSNSSVYLSGSQQFFNIEGAPVAPPANVTALYHNYAGEGGSGMWVLSTTVNDELVTAKKALLYSIIF